MNTKRKNPHRVALASIIFLCVLTIKGFGANYFVGFGFGFSLPLKDARIATFPEYYRTAGPKESLNPSIGIIFNGHFSLAVEMLYQSYDAVDHSHDGAAIQTWNNYSHFSHFGAVLEYRFFDDIRKPWNPYVSVAVYGPVSGGQEGYPDTPSFEVALGTRIKVARSLYINPKAGYVSGITSLSLRAALEYIF